jgi:hypothetical protein
VNVGHIGDPSEPLQPGELVELYDELLVMAHVEYDAEADYWLAAPDWASRSATPPDLAATIH